MRIKYKIILLTLLTILVVSCANEMGTSDASTSSSKSSNYDEISANSASSNIGSYKTVCGQIVDTRYASSSNGSPTFLNFEKPYPQHPFVVVIWGKDRNNFSGKPEITYKGKKVCVDGLIESYKGKPQIVVNDPSQIN